MTRSVSDELRPLYEGVQRALSALLQLTSGPGTVQKGSAGKDYLDLLSSLIAEAESCGSVGLQDVFYLLQAEAEELIEAESLNPDRLSLQQHACELVMAYLLDRQSGDSASALLRHFQDTGWSSPLTDEDVEMFCDMLMAEPEPEPELELDLTASSVSVAVEMVDESSQSEAGIDGAERDVIRQEVLTLLQGEIESLADAMSQSLNGAQKQGGSWGELLNRAADELELFSSAVSAVHMDGLAEVCFYLQGNLRAWAVRSQPLSARERELLDGWVAQTRQYLKAVNDEAACAELVAYLSDPAWPSPLPAHDAEGIAELLASPEVASGPMAKVARQVQADVTDVELDLPRDVNADLLDALLQELPQQTSDFSSAIKKIVEGEGDLDDVKLAQRVAHSLKGAGNTVGIRGIANLTHHLEDILQLFFEQSRLPQGELANVLMDASDCLEAMSEAILGIGAAPTHAVEVLQSVLDWANRIDEEGLDAPGVSSVVAPPKSEKAVAVEVKSTQSGVAGTAPTSNMVRVPAALMDELLRLGGESIIVTGQVKSRVQQIRQQARAMRLQYRLVQQLTYEMEQLVSVSDALATTGTTMSSDAGAVELEQYNELHSCLSRLEESVADAKEFADAMHENLYVVEDLVIEQERFQQDNQEAIYRSRMVPVSTIVPRCERGVRQACRLTEKSVDFRIEGSETMMDNQVLGEFIEPLMHLLRNSVDHGIESVEQRRAANKPETGSIVLNFARVGDLIEVICQDDGAGLDTDKIRETAIAKGVISETEELSEAEINQLILLPGFTTKGAATQVSGRGVGMDAVYAKIKEMKGALSLHSRRNEGLKVVLHLPVSLLSVSAILVESSDSPVALSNYGVERVVDVAAGELRETENGLFFVFEGEPIPATYLDILMGRSSYGRNPLCVFIVRPDIGPRQAVLVDKVVLSDTDVVVKNMGAYLPPLVGVVGVTILGDGRVAPVLDIPELLRSERHGHALYQPDLVEIVETTRSALVVDDSLSARRALVGFMSDCGFKVNSAIDGVEALEIVGQQVPDILLIDMEMPRMNGIELTTRLRADNATKETPIIMITSRSTAKHKKQAEEAGVNVYLIKPFNEVELQNHINALLS